MRHVRRVLSAGALACLAACAPPARFVLVEPNGGTVAIPRNTQQSRDQALALIAQKCPRGYEIVREEEVLVGATVSREQGTEFDRVGEELRTRERGRIRADREWRITFTCR